MKGETEHFPELPSANVDEQELRKEKGKIEAEKERRLKKKLTGDFKYNELDRRSQLFFKPMPRDEESCCGRVMELQH